MTRVNSSGIIDLFLSDQVLIYLIKKIITKKMKSHSTFMGRTFRNYSPEILQAKINQNLDLNNLLNVNNPEECWNIL